MIILLRSVWQCCSSFDFLYNQNPPLCIIFLLLLDIYYSYFLLNYEVQGNPLWKACFPKLNKCMILSKVNEYSWS